MAGRAEKKRIKNPVLEDLLEKYYAEVEQRGKKAWQEKWAWLIDEYRLLEEKGAEITRKSDILTKVEKVRERDDRNVRPIPETTNGLYGWLTTKPDFKLDIFGPDVDEPMPLPEQFHLDKRIE